MRMIHDSLKFLKIGLHTVKNMYSIKAREINDIYKSGFIFVQIELVPFQNRTSTSKSLLSVEVFVCVKG